MDRPLEIEQVEIASEQGRKLAANIGMLFAPGRHARWQAVSVWPLVGTAGRSGFGVPQMNKTPQPRNIYRDITLLLVVLALILLGVGLYEWRPAALYALVPYAFFLLCPLAMWFMMRSMGNKNGPQR